MVLTEKIHIAHQELWEHVKKLPACLLLTSKSLQSGCCTRKINMYQNGLQVHHDYRIAWESRISKNADRERYRSLR